jgi:hypothetical protein
VQNVVLGALKRRVVWHVYHVCFYWCEAIILCSLFGLHLAGYDYSAHQVHRYNLMFPYSLVEFIISSEEASKFCNDPWRMRFRGIMCNLVFLLVWHWQCAGTYPHKGRINIFFYQMNYGNKNKHTTNVFMQMFESPSSKTDWIYRKLKWFVNLTMISCWLSIQFRTSSWKKHIPTSPFWK